MRILAVTFFASVVLACSGVSTGGNDGGDSDAADDKTPTPIDCNGSTCADYCIRPSANTCPTCVPASDAGTCPNYSTLQNGCPAGPAMPPGQYCVHYPAPDPPYCSPTVPSSCFPVSQPPPAPSDVQCNTVCAS